MALWGEPERGCVALDARTQAAETNYVLIIHTIMYVGTLVVCMYCIVEFDHLGMNNRLIKI